MRLFLYWRWSLAVGLPDLFLRTPVSFGEKTKQGNFKFM